MSYNSDRRANALTPVTTAGNRSRRTAGESIHPAPVPIPAIVRTPAVDFMPVPFSAQAPVSAPVEDRQLELELPGPRLSKLELKEHIIVHGTAGDDVDGPYKHAAWRDLEDIARSQLRDAGLDRIEKRLLTFSLGLAEQDAETGILSVVASNCLNYHGSFDHMVYQPLIQRDATWSDAEWDVAFRSNRLAQSTKKARLMAERQVSR